MRHRCGRFGLKICMWKSSNYGWTPGPTTEHLYPREWTCLVKVCFYGQCQSCDWFRKLTSSKNSWGPEMQWTHCYLCPAFFMSGFTWQKNQLTSFRPDQFIVQTTLIGFHLPYKCSERWMFPVPPVILSCKDTHKLLLLKTLLWNCVGL